MEKLSCQIHIQKKPSMTLLALVYSYFKKKLVQVLVQFCSTINSQNFQELKSIVTEQNTALLTTMALIVMSPVISLIPVIF